MRLNDRPGNYYELDVTELVLNDYAYKGDNPLRAFRIQVSEAAFVDDDPTNFY